MPVTCEFMLIFLHFYWTSIKSICMAPFPGVMKEEYCFFYSPTNFPFWLACHLSFKRSFRVLSEIDSVCLSVPWSSNEQLAFVFILNHLCYISMNLSQTISTIYSNFEFIFKFLVENPKKIKLHEYWLKCYVLYINGFVPTSSTNKWKVFTNFNFFFIIFKVLAKKKFKRIVMYLFWSKSYALCMQHFIWLCFPFESNSSLWYIIMGGIAILIIMWIVFFLFLLHFQNLPKTCFFKNRKAVLPLCGCLMLCIIQSGITSPMRATIFLNNCAIG